MQVVVEEVRMERMMMMIIVNDGDEVGGDVLRTHIELSQGSLTEGDM